MPGPDPAPGAPAPGSAPLSQDPPAVEAPAPGRQDPSVDALVPDDAAGSSARTGGPEPPVPAGTIGRPHGLDGSFHLAAARARLLAVGGTVEVGGVERRIERLAGTDERPIVRLEGVGSREALEPLRGTTLGVPRSALPALEEDEFWPEDLVGLAVRDVDGATVGTVRAVLDLPSCDVLEVERPGAPVLLVPLVRDAVPDLDFAAADPVVRVDLRFLDEA